MKALKTTWLLLAGTLLLASSFLWLSLFPESGKRAFMSPAQAASELPAPLTAPATCIIFYDTWDAEPTYNRNDINNAAPLSNYTLQTLIQGTAGTVTSPTLATAWDDYYRLDNASVGYLYTVRAVPDLTTNYDLGMVLYDSTRTAVYTDSNPFDGNSAIITFQATDIGPYYFKVFQRSGQCSWSSNRASTYSLVLGAAAPTPTATPTPTPSPTPPGPAPTPRRDHDDYEPNYDFDTAAIIAPSMTYNLNFVPWGGAQVDNDYFKLWAKPGLVFSCETFDLDPGVDTNMRFFDGNRNPIGGNDDRALGDYSSYYSYYSTYEGWLYVEVGHGGRLSVSDIADSEYKLRCQMTAPGAVGTVTPAPGKDPITPPVVTPRPTATPTPVTSPLPTPTDNGNGNGTGGSTVELSIRPLTTPVPLTPTPTPGGVRTFGLLIYYDANQDGQPGAGEGVSGFFARALSTTNGTELARGYTDEQGRISFSVPTVGPVRVLVPLLGMDRYVDASTPELIVRISPLPVPSTIP